MGLVESKDLFNRPFYYSYVKDDLTVQPISRDIAHNLIKLKHYSHKVVNNPYIFYGLYHKSILQGVATFGYALNPSSASKIVKDTKNDEYLELNRFWVDDCMPRNTESFFLSACFKLIKHQPPKIGWIQSFADERCGKLGVLYQASNFLYVGCHTTEFAEINGVFYHKIQFTALKRKTKLLLPNQPVIYHQFKQYRYIYFIKKHLIKNLLLNILPYPKLQNN